jgi:hypothetical protein
MVMAEYTKISKEEKLAKEAPKVKKYLQEQGLDVKEDNVRKYYEATYTNYPKKAVRYMVEYLSK